MKKLMFLLAGITIPILWTSGQITLTPNDFPLAGLSLEIFEANFSPSDSLFISDTTLFKIGEKGANSEFDFSKLDSLITDTLIVQFISANSTPFSSSHPNADIAVIDDSAKLYKYYSVDSNSFIYIGYTTITQMDSNTIDTIHFSFSGSELIMSVDFSLNYQYDGIYGYGTQYDSISGMSVLTKDTIEIDSYGNLTTPTDTFQVLRAHILSENHFTYWQLPFSVDVFSNNEQYKYFSNNIGYPLVTVTVDGEYQRILNIQYVNTEQVIQNISKISQSIEFNIYPNPTSKHIRIEFNNTNNESFTLTVYNSIGQKVIQRPNVYSGLTLDLSQLNKGLYYLTVTSNKDKERRVFNKKIVVID